MAEKSENQISIYISFQPEPPHRFSQCANDVLSVRFSTTGGAAFLPSHSCLLIHFGASARSRTLFGLHLTALFLDGIVLRHSFYKVFNA